MKRFVPVLAIGALALAACNSSADDPGAGPVTQEEAEALEDAASMLDEQRMPEETPATADETREGDTP